MLVECCLEHWLAGPFVLVLCLTLEVSTVAMGICRHGASVLAQLLNPSVSRGSGKYQKKQVTNIFASGSNHKRERNMLEVCLHHRPTNL